MQNEYDFDVEGTGAGETVAVIDSGWSKYKQSDRVRRGVSMVDGGQRKGEHDIHDKIGHGTMCADILLRVAPEVEVVPVKVFRKTLNTSPRALYDALKWVEDKNFSVINLSLSTTREDMVDRLYYWCTKIVSGGTTIVASSHRKSEWCFPAVFDNVIGVKQTQHAGSNSRDDKHKIRLRVDPEQAIECTVSGVHRNVRVTRGAAERVVSHSTAAPVVSGLAARIKANNEDLHHAGILNTMSTSLSPRT
jgi:hypothetical protein